MNTRTRRMLGTMFMVPLFVGALGAVIWICDPSHHISPLYLFGVVSLTSFLVGCLEVWMPFDLEWRPTDPQQRRSEVIHYVINGTYKVGALAVAMLLAHMQPPSAYWLSLSFPVQVLLGVLAFDLILYGYHRLSHADNLFWRLHLIHHVPTKLNFLNAETKHPIVAPIVGLIATVIFSLLGVPAEVMLACVVVLHISEMFQHANVDYAMGYLKYVFACAETHRFHHHQEPDKGNVNFAEICSLIDVMFGTFSNHPEHRVTHKNAGVFGHDRFPFSSYLAQLRYPFIKANFSFATTRQGVTS